MLAGEQQYTLKVYELVTTKDSYSQRVKSYSYSFSTRAKFSFISGENKLVGQLQLSDQILKFRVRYVKGKYNNDQVLKLDDDYYKIESIDPDPKRQYFFMIGKRAAKGSINLTE